jgi:type I restriction enzyme M protein
MADGLTLVCPVRGRLKVTGRTSDGLSPSEERFRVEAIKYLIDKGYPKSHFVIEPVIKRFGNAGRNSFRADFAILDVPATEAGRGSEELLQHAVLLAEVKRDNASAEDAKQYQVKPLLAFAAHDRCMAVYWDNVERRVFWQVVDEGQRTVQEGPVASLPPFGGKPGLKALKIADLLRNETSLKSIFERIEDVLHSSSIGPARRFTMMLQLLLAKLHDEHQHEIHPDQAMVVQDYQSLGIGATAAKTTLDQQVRAVYLSANNEQSRGLPNYSRCAWPAVDEDTRACLEPIVNPLRAVGSG